jgi:hypothetical protein
MKYSLKSMKFEKKSLQYKLNVFLMRYRITPHCTTGEAPSKLMMGRVIRNNFDLMKPNLKVIVEEKQQASPKNLLPYTSLDVGDHVLYRDYSSSDKWLSGTVFQQTGPVSYKVQSDNDNSSVRRHKNQLRKIGTDAIIKPPDTMDPIMSDNEETPEEMVPLRRSLRERRKVQRFGNNIYDS